jgi:hypothetical protein
MDFLATNDFGKSNDPDMIRRYLSKLEGLLGCHLVAVSPQREVVYAAPEAVQIVSELFEKGEPDEAADQS